eukprot:a175495_834.p1 GENE.a175495_834~~a175495_834.p1  ORF type:complete len:103 (+),score=48.63 a175495_834:39-311(+)
MAAGSIEERFRAVCEEVRTGPPRESSNEDKLILYGLFKQATEGDARQEDKPGMFAAYSEKGYKWDAWNKNKGMTKETAMQSYIDKINSMK